MVKLKIKSLKGRRVISPRYVSFEICILKIKYFWGSLLKYLFSTRRLEQNSYKSFIDLKLYTDHKKQTRDHVTNTPRAPWWNR